MYIYIYTGRWTKFHFNWYSGHRNFNWSIYVLVSWGKVTRNSWFCHPKWYENLVFSMIVWFIRSGCAEHFLAEDPPWWGWTLKSSEKKTSPWLGDLGDTRNIPLFRRRTGFWGPVFFYHTAHPFFVPGTGFSMIFSKNPERAPEAHARHCQWAAGGLPKAWCRWDSSRASGTTSEKFCQRPSWFVKHLHL